MEFLQPETWADALAAKAEVPAALPIIGGTDVMVELNFDRQRPFALLDLTRVAELADWAVEDGLLRIGAGVTYTRIIHELADRLPGLAMASRTVGSPQIRNRGTVGGNLGSASPAGDAHPPLLATDALVEVGSVRGTRRMPIADFFTGPKRHALAPDELIAAFLVPPAGGPQQFAKIGTRNAMVIAVASFGLALHPEHGTVGLRSARPPQRRCSPARPRRLPAPSSATPGCGRRGPRCRRSSRNALASWSRWPPHQSTTCAAALPTDGMPWRCSPSGP